MTELLQWLSTAWAATSNWELLAVALAIAYLLLAMRQNVLCWPAALISTAIYTWLFFSVTLVMESLLQIYYMAMAIYGWYAWTNKTDKGDTLTISRWSLRQHISALVVILVLTTASATLLENTNASYPWLDSFTTWSAVLTTWMVARKVLENWLYWIVINSISIYLYLNKDLYATSLLFGLYIILSISGYMMWKKTTMTRSIANLKRYLEMVPELSSRMLISYKHLTQGITNESYHLKFTKDEYVIKFFNHEAIDLGIDHKKEMHIMSALESLDVAPVIIYIDLDEEFSIARWIEGDYWTLADYDDPLKVQQLIDRIRAIHALPCDDLPRVNLIQSIHAYRDKIAPDSDYSELLRDDLLQRATATITKTDQLMAHVLCHNDLLNSNILVNDDIHFFDWEFAGVNSPMFELAVICQGNQLNQAQQSLLLNGYFGDQWQDYQSLLTDWLWIYEYVALLWEVAVQKQDEESTSSQHERLAALLSG